MIATLKAQHSRSMSTACAQHSKALHHTASCRTFLVARHTQSKVLVEYLHSTLQSIRAQSAVMNRVCRSCRRIMHACIRSSVRSFVCSAFIHPFVRPFVCSFVRCVALRCTVLVLPFPSFGAAFVVVRTFANCAGGRMSISRSVGWTLGFGLRSFVRRAVSRSFVRSVNQRKQALTDRPTNRPTAARSAVSHQRSASGQSAVSQRSAAVQQW